MCIFLHSLNIVPAGESNPGENRSGFLALYILYLNTFYCQFPNLVAFFLELPFKLLHLS